MDVEELRYSVSLSPIISSVTLLALVLLFGFTPVEGQHQVIGSRRPIVAALGDDVVLPCHVAPPLDVEAMTVEWSRPDPDDRQSRFEYVHFYRNNRDFPDMKIPSFLNRTTLFTDGLRRGNISLKITNVTLADKGRFKCLIPKLKSQVQSSIVLLDVVKTDPNSTKTWTTEPPLQTRSNQTPGLNGKTDANGLSGRNRWTMVVVFCIFFLVILIFITKESKLLKVST